MISNYFIGEAEQISELSVFATQNIPVISLASPFLTPDKLTHTLDSEYGIMTRPGLHCSPLAHKSIGTFPQGTVRFSPGYFNTEEQIIYTIQSLKTIFSNINKQQ
jgi:cysteine desulfurase / selenocysteine lyase